MRPLISFLRRVLRPASSSSLAEAAEAEEGPFVVAVGGEAAGVMGEESAGVIIPLIGREDRRY